jgi:signal transduction histidine kinase
MSPQQYALSKLELPALQRLEDEKRKLQQYLNAQKKVISSLERRVGRSLEFLGVNVKRMTAAVDSTTDWQASLVSVQSEIDSLCDLLADAMLLQKLEAGKVEINLEPLALEPLLICVSRHLLEPRNNTPVRLICEFAPQLPAILTDQDLTEAVLTDLLARGLRYSDPDIPVILGAKQVVEWVHLQVTAQRFSPVGNRDFATEIALCCRRIEVQKGTITCQSRPDGLQTVTIALRAAS